MRRARRLLLTESSGYLGKVKEGSHLPTGPRSPAWSLHLAGPDGPELPVQEEVVFLLPRPTSTGHVGAGTRYLGLPDPGVTWGL